MGDPARPLARLVRHAAIATGSAGLLALGLAGCSVSEHVYGPAASTAPYPRTAAVPATAPADPLTPTQVADARSKLDELGGEHSQKAIEQIERSGR